MAKRRKAPIRGYPAPSLILNRGQWSVKVNIPSNLRHLFGNGSGTTSDRRLATGETDEFRAEARKMELAHLIYDEFDKRRREYSERHDAQTDLFAIDAIYSLAHSFNHKPIPDLKPSTNYHDLVAFKTACDVYANMILNAVTKAEAETLNSLIISSPSSEEVVEKFRELQKGSQYSTHQKGLAGRYKTSIVHNYWQDLLIQTAREQALPEPNPEAFVGVDAPLIKVEDQIHIDSPLIKGTTNQIVEPIRRPARISPAKVITFGSVMEEYLEDMRLKQNSLDTQRKLTRWAKQFLAVMGDLELKAIKPHHGYQYTREILKKHPTRSNQTLKDYLWGAQNLLRYCVESGYIDINPFRGLDIAKYGEQSKETYVYSSEELTKIFKHDWSPQERLLLSILATTGMRPSEAGNLTWERFNSTEHNGIRFFTTLDTENETVRVKNAGSKRDVPIHPKLWLPEQAKGRLFDYRKDDDGRCSTSIGHVINPVLDKLVPHPNKSIKSLRRTFKGAMRDLGVGEEVHDAITGHNQTINASRKSYGGMGVRVKFEAVSKLDVSFLQQT